MHIHHRVQQRQLPATACSRRGVLTWSIVAQRAPDMTGSARPRALEMLQRTQGVSTCSELGAPARRTPGPHLDASPRAPYPSEVQTTSPSSRARAHGRASPRPPLPLERRRRRGVGVGGARSGAWRGSARCWLLLVGCAELVRREIELAALQPSRVRDRVLLSQSTSSASTHLTCIIRSDRQRPFKHLGRAAGDLVKY